MNSESDIPKVIIMDMLCMIPIYDRYLAEALNRQHPSTLLGSISFHLDIEYFNRYSIKRMKLVDIISKLNIRNEKLRRFLKVVEYIANLFQLFLYLIFKHYKIIHVQWIPLITVTSIELWFLKLVRKFGVKTVYTVHNVLPHDSGLRHQLKYDKVYSAMDALICHTLQSKNELVSRFGIAEEKIWVISHGPMLYESTETDEEAKANLSIPDDRVVILFFGSIRPYKGLEFLLEAWQKVVETTSSVLLVIAGNGEASYLDSISNKISTLNLSGHVKCNFEYISDNSVSTYFQAADILVYPYKDVTQSGALLTGMTFGKPIVASNCEGFIETLKNGKAGKLIEYGNVNDLADTLIELIRLPEERSRLGNAAYKELHDNYSWDAIAGETLLCYRSVSMK